MIIEERIWSQQRCPVVRVDVILAFALFHRVQVTQRDCKGTSLEDVKGATEKFGPLKAVLGAIPAIYANREVRRQQPQDSSLMNTPQESVAIGNKVEVLLSHVVTLEECFDSRPGDVTEQRRRDQLIRYVTCHCLSCELGSEYPLAGLNTYGNNW